jgi:quercetin dioxygenase-like cupin family protein
MLPRILHPEQLQGYRLSSHDHCRLALLNRPESSGCTVFLEVHDPCDRVPPHSHHRGAELFFVLRGTVLFHVGDRSISASGGDVVVVPEEALHDLRGIRRELQRQQERASVVMPLWFEPELMGLVHAWAKGVSWNDLIANTSLDEGEGVRIMRRTVDLLAQVPYCEAISQRLRDHARAALKAINRFPVCEPIDLMAGGGGLNPATARATETPADGTIIPAA